MFLDGVIGRDGIGNTASCLYPCQKHYLNAYGAGTEPRPTKTIFPANDVIAGVGPASVPAWYGNSMHGKA
jgi:hypothetical protein